MNNGYIKVFRSMLDSFFWNDSQAVHLWIQLLLSANHKKRDIILNGKKVTIEKGQFVTSRKSLSEKTGINDSKVQRLLKLFESEQQIEQQMNSKYRIISISNWNQYQESEQQIEQQMNSKRTADEQHTNTNKNDKNGKNGKEKTSKKESEQSSLFEIEQPEDEFARIWELYGKKGNRKKSIERWIKIKQKDKQKIFEHVPKYVLSTPDIKFRKDFQTYLNNECWNDRIISNKCEADLSYKPKTRQDGKPLF